MTTRSPRAKLAALLACRLLCGGGRRGAPSFPSPATAEDAAVPFGDRCGGGASSPPAGPLPDPPEAVRSGEGSGEGCAREADRSSPSSSSPPPSSSSPSPPSSSSSPAAASSAVPSGRLYCPADYDENEDYHVFTSLDCFYDGPHRWNGNAATTGDPSSALGDFVVPHDLRPGQVVPVVWRDGGKVVSQRALQVGLPDELAAALLAYADARGIAELLRTECASSDDRSGSDGGRLVELPGGTSWYVQRPAGREEEGRRRSSDARRISPANEATHEEYLWVLADGNFDVVLEGIGDALGLYGLVAYQLAFVGMTFNEGEDERRVATTGTNGGAYEVVVPLLLEDDDGSSPELTLWDDAEYADDSWNGGYKHRVGVGVVMGDDVVYATRERDLRDPTRARPGGPDENGKRAGMRLTAIVHVAEVYYENARRVADTASQIFPPKDRDWLLAQEARHWQAEGGGYPFRNGMRGDAGRRAFRKGDASDDCKERAEDGMCESDAEGTRRMCPFSCGVFIREGPTRVRRVDSTSVEVCVQNRTAMEECQVYEDDASVDGDFAVPNLEPGEMFPIVWRSDGKRATDFAFQVGVPQELTETLLRYANALGVTDLMREYTSSDPILPGEEMHDHEFVELSDGNHWYAQWPAKKWAGNVHWVSPADEETHEEYLRVLAAGNFDAVLDGIGKYLGLEGLAAYHLTFIGVSHSEKGPLQCTHHTGGSAYKVIIPLILGSDAKPELAISDRDDESRLGALKYRVGTAAMMGDDSMHGAEECDYRVVGGMRLVAMVYIADINVENSRKIAQQTLTQIFPLPDAAWLMAQAGRHWVADADVEGVEGRNLEGDEGRRHFSFRDMISDCAERASKGMCVTDRYTRVKCLESCEIYQSNGEDNGEGVLEFELDFDTYEPGQFIDAFFNSLENEDDSCFDESKECDAKAQMGLCMTAMGEMEELGCYRSCMYCLTPSSRDLFSLGVHQVMEESDSEDEASGEEEGEYPSPRKVLESIARTEHYFVNEVFEHEDLRVYRLSCQNQNKNCAIWAAEGYCESTPGYMGKVCSAACRKCPMVDEGP